MWLSLLLLGAPPEEMTLPPKVWGDVSATLSVRIADQPPQPGSAGVRLRFTVEGPAGFTVEEPVLEDALAAWSVAGRTSAVRLDGRRWECTLELVQVKPGVVPLPGVSIGVKAGGSAEKFAWSDLLHESADVAPVVEVPPPPPSPWLGLLCMAGLIGMGLLVLAGVAFGVRRWATRPRPALPPLEAALTAIDRVRQSPAGPLGLVMDIDHVLRAYLETLGIPATRLTGVELHDRLRDVKGDELVAILVRVEESKFAGNVVRAEEVREMADEAHRALLAILDREGRQG
jgi:hypothetical protein